MAFEVLLTAGAEQDLEDIYDYIAESDSSAKADYVLTRLLEAADHLALSPIAAPVRRSCRHLASGNIARPSSSRIASSIG